MQVPSLITGFRGCLAANRDLKKTPPEQGFVVRDRAKSA